jgi:hypothetical protein
MARNIGCVLYAAVDGLAGWKPRSMMTEQGPRLAVMVSRSESVGHKTGFKVKGKYWCVLRTWKIWLNGALKYMRYVKKLSDSMPCYYNLNY